MTKTSICANAVLGAILLATNAIAQTPPPATAPVVQQPATAAPVKPKPKPKPKPRAPMSLAAPGNAPAAGNPPRPPAEVATPQLPPPPPAVQAPQIVQPSPPRPGQPALNGKQLALVERVSGYLSNLRTLVGEFKQIAPDGSQSAGDFYLMKPGRVRFDYNPPSPTEVVADGRSVVVRDRNLASQDSYPISQTPLRFLLADQINLLKDTNVVAVYGDNVFITVVIEERQIMRGTYRVMMMFDAQNTQLKQWVVTDPQGLDTTVAVYNLDLNTKPDPELFKIDYTRYIR